MLKMAESTLPLFVATSVTTVSHTTDETSLLSDGTGMRTIAAGRIHAGDTVYMNLSGHFSTGERPVRLTIRFKMGGVPVLEAVSVPVPENCAENPWRFEAAYACQEAGEQGRCVGIRMFSYLHAPTIPVTWVLIQREPLHFDTRPQYDFDVTAEWSVADPANTITCDRAEIDLAHVPLSESIRIA